MMVKVIQYVTAAPGHFEESRFVGPAQITWFRAGFLAPRSLRDSGRTCTGMA
jgi:hypothetical protein